MAMFDATRHAQYVNR